MSGSKSSRGWIVGTVLAVVLVGAAVGAGIYLNATTTIVPSAAIVPPPPPSAPAPVASPPAAPPPTPPAAECMVPGPAPVMPRGTVATAEDMKIQHDAVQAYVKALEAFQACVNAEIDNAPPGTDENTKRAWIAESNHAIDRAQALADAFAEQQRIYKARQSEVPPAK
jgi:hypothetical protein